ncbi:MAG: hypothetical protein P8R42_12920 [Candidatus Binatia bacterium]|nr:hypothetical protein [Candidatus Binatia bacterium]
MITWEDVPEFGSSSQSSFQLELFFDGVIRMTHLPIAATDGISGLSEGNGEPADFQESELTGYGPCATPTPTPAPTQTATPTPTPTPPCGLAPATGCRSGEAGKSRLQIRVTGVPTKDTFTWKLNKADETLLGEFADPVSEDVATYRVCVYDESGGAQPLVEAEMPPMGTCDGKPCWGNTGTKGFRGCPRRHGGSRLRPLASIRVGQSPVLPISRRGRRRA